jgi:hypothetical protein
MAVTGVLGRMGRRVDGLSQREEREQIEEAVGDDEGRCATVWGWNRAELMGCGESPASSRDG